LVAGFGALTLDVLWGVFSRYVLGEQSPWTEELAIYLLVWVSLLGAALTYSEKGHLGVDYFVGKMDPEAQKVAALVVELIVLSFASFAFCYGGWVLVSETLTSGQLSPGLGIKMGYVYCAVPLCGAFFTLFAAEHLWRLLSEQTPAASSDDAGTP
jgi:TRAP-type C4-dicarboxylate transport system permease small subunit